MIRHQNVGVGGRAWSGGWEGEPMIGQGVCVAGGVGVETDWLVSNCT